MHLCDSRYKGRLTEIIGVEYLYYLPNFTGQDDVNAHLNNLNPRLLELVERFLHEKYD